MKMQVVIPMGGAGERFLKAGYKDPKPLLDVAGEPLIKRLLRQFPADWRFVFACNAEHLKKTRLREVLLGCAPKGVIVPITPHKLGPVYSVLEASAQIDDNLPTIVNYCDFSFSWDPDHFSSFVEKTRCDGAVFCYRGFHPHYLGDTLYAYCREEGGVICEIREKAHFTPDRTQEYASSGTYFFSSGKLVKKAFAQAKKDNLALNGEFYVSLVYNPLIKAGKKNLVYEIPFMLQWGTPEDLEDYTYWHRTFARFANQTEFNDSKNPRLLMPMAGFGSRFKKGETPKPLIPVMNRPMFEAARHMLPCRLDNTVFVVREGLTIETADREPTQQIVRLPEPTRGQAETVLKALHLFKDDEPVLVSACDHGLLWNNQTWKNLIDSSVDVAVVGQRHYPGARRTPRNYAYLDVDRANRIKRVFVKEPMSARPQDDLLLVGTFYFRRARRLGKAIEELIQQDKRVNGEYYLDSAIQVCVDNGWDVRSFESDAYLNWGSPEALAEFSYWNRYFSRHPGNL